MPGSYLPGSVDGAGVDEKYCNSGLIGTLEKSNYHHINSPIEASRSVKTQACECKRDRCYSIHIRGNEIFNIFSGLTLMLRQSAALSYATQHAMPSDFGGK